MLRRLTSGFTIGALTVLAAGVSARGEIIEQVLVKVNGEILTKTEFEQRQVADLRSRPDLATARTDSPELARAVAEVTPKLILAAVDEMLLVQRGRELGYTMGDAQFNEIVANIKKQNNLEDDKKFEAALAQEGLTLADLRKNLERQMLVSRVQQVDVMDKISVTEAESTAYYEAHAKDFTTPSQVTLREILIEVPASDRGVNVAEDDAAREKAEQVRARLVAGEPFARIAGEVSAAASKSNGGLIGPISHEELAPALQKALDALDVGGLTPVMRTTRGYQILKLESRTDRHIRTFEEARDDISRKVAEEKSRGDMLKYIDRLRQQATITWRNDELHKAYDMALQQRARETAGQAQG